MAKSLKLTVVVSGTPIKDEAQSQDLLSTVAEKAIKKAGSKETDLSKWKLTDANKVELNFDQTVGGAGIQDGATLFLDLRAGVTG